MRVGIVGAGQLARMLLESASALGVECVVLAESPGDAAALTAHDVVLGSPRDAGALVRLADVVDVVTFDHELVDLELLAALEQDVTIAPSPRALRFAVDKAAMRRALFDHGLPCPRFEVVEPTEHVDAGQLGGRLGWPLVIKAATGGYDGRGVFVVDDATEATGVLENLAHAGVTALIEERVEIVAELAALVARTPSGAFAAWPVVETAQIDGVCREVLVPGSVSEAQRIEGAALAQRIAEFVDVVGVMAVELFATPTGIVVNELAMRPHNSGHWTQDGAVTSQFENHLRAILDLPLGSTDMVAKEVASVNVFGGDDALDPKASLADALAIPTAHLHLYGKEPRPGRKLGHVNVVGTDPDVVRSTAWQAARALGTPVPDALDKEAR